MFKDVLTHMEHATWYANVGLLIFIAVFVGVSLRAMLASKREVAQHATLPLNDEPVSFQISKNISGKGE